MLTGITTRPSTPQEDAEPWPGGSARPVLDYLTGTLGMTGADARELLKAARTAQAQAGPGALADYPVPGRDERLLIHYAPGSRAYRFKLTAPENEARPGSSPEPGTAPGNRPGPDGPSRGRGTPGGAAQPGLAGITVTIWHNVAFDDQGRHTGMLDGYQPGDPVVRVFAYQADPTGRPPEEIAEEAFAIFNDHPGDAARAELACAYYGRRLRSLSAGDVVAAGDVLLAVGRPVGWEPVTGPLTEVRTPEHGTNPLPDPGWLPGAGTPGRPCPRDPARGRVRITIARPAVRHQRRTGMTACEGEQRPVKPVYLSGVLTVEAELSAGRLYDGSAHAENASRVLVALVSIGGAAMLFTEDESGQLTRLRIPGPEFLRLTDDAAGKLARSRQQPPSHSAASTH